MKNPRIRNTSHQSSKAFQRSRERLVHVSAPIIEHPLHKHHRIAGTLLDYNGPQFMVDKGTTRNVGRNKAKRTRRATMIADFGSVRAYRRELSIYHAHA